MAPSLQSSLLVFLLLPVLFAGECELVRHLNAPAEHCCDEPAISKSDSDVCPLAAWTPAVFVQSGSGKLTQREASKFLVIADPGWPRPLTHAPFFMRVCNSSVLSIQILHCTFQI